MQPTTEDILAKLSIAALNPMQEEALEIIPKHSETVLLSPTGSGKTLAFLLPIVAGLDPEESEIQTMILVPSRELAMQIEQVTRSMGSGYKVNAVYGGRAGSQDKIDLKHRPAILVGTPGRMADHLRKGTFAVDRVKTLVLDEFDKSLEIGFEEDMKEIVEALTGLKKKVLTSATNSVEIPAFVQLDKPRWINYQKEGVSSLAIKTIMSPEKDKLDTLYRTLCHLGNQPGIIFCNFRDAIERVSDFLENKGIAHGSFHGGMEQRDRERALIKFRNGTYQTLLATDLAARGIDVPELSYIIHYHLPNRAQEFTHRNGRTARMHQSGTAFVLLGRGEERPDFIPETDVMVIEDAPRPKRSKWLTLHISGGRRDKISKGDVAGLFFKQGGLSKDQLGVIELKPEASFVAVEASQAHRLVSELNNSRLKKKKVRITMG